MTIKHFDGFDLYTDNTDFLTHYQPFSTPIWTAGAGRFGGAGVVTNHHSDSFNYTLADRDAYIAMGCAVKTDMAGESTGVLSHYDRITDDHRYYDVAVTVQSDGALRLIDNSEATVATSAPGVVSADSWFYLELIFHRDNAGTAKVYVNGTEVLSAASDYLYIGGASIAHFGSSEYFGISTTVYDDIYCASDPSSLPTPLGDVAIGLQALDGNDAQNDWGGDFSWLGTNDGDASKMSSTTLGHKSEFTLADMPASSAVHAVSTITRSSKSSAGVIQIKAYLDSGGTEAAGAAIVPSESGYGLSRDTYIVDPATGSQWTEAGVNSLKVGVEVTG